MSDVPLGGVERLARDVDRPADLQDTDLGRLDLDCEMITLRGSIAAISDLLSACSDGDVRASDLAELMKLVGDKAADIDVRTRALLDR